MMQYLSQKPHCNPFYYYVQFQTRLAARAEAGFAPFLPYMKLFLSGLYGIPLPPHPITVNRGIDQEVLHLHHVGKSICWWQFISTTDNISQVGAFLGAQEHTVFQITTRSVVSISKFSAMPVENEWIILPLTLLKVVGVLPQARMLQLRDMDGPVLLDYAHPMLKKAVSLQT